jgi:DegV family protein with EDD domain
MTRRVAVVTDSTAYLPPQLAERYGVSVVSLQVAVGTNAGTEGDDVRPAEVARALTERRTAVKTSRPAPAEFAAAYRDAFDHGAEAVLSLHISSQLSGTCQAARLAAEEVGGPIEVLDSGSVAMGLGYAVLAAAEVADSGGDLAAVAAAARSTMDRTSIFFYVDTLEYLRRGGRIGAAAALLGTALSVKPILHVRDGAVVVREKVRTAGRALARMEELAVEAAGGRGCDIAIHHLEAADRAAELRKRLTARLQSVGRVVVSEVGPVVGAHTGPGVLGVVIVREP